MGPEGSGEKPSEFRLNALKRVRWDAAENSDESQGDKNQDNTFDSYSRVTMDFTCSFLASPFLLCAGLAS
jgi:hypothetical protein